MWKTENIYSKSILGYDIKLIKQVSDTKIVKNTKKLSYNSMEENMITGCFTVYCRKWKSYHAKKKR